MGMAWDLAGSWHLTTDPKDVFAFEIQKDDQHVRMTISEGCVGCAFTDAYGVVSVDRQSVDIVASGKGVWIRQQGVLEDNGCRITWQQNTSDHHWADFVKKESACSAMLLDGYWKPWDVDEKHDAAALILGPLGIRDTTYLL